MGVRGRASVVLALFTVAAGCSNLKELEPEPASGSGGGDSGGSSAGSSGSSGSANGGNQGGGGAGNQGGASGSGVPISGGGGTGGPAITDCPVGLHYCPTMGCVDSKSPASCGLSCEACPTITGGGTTTCNGTICGGSCPSDMVLCKGTCIAGNAACMGTCPAGSHDCSGLCVSNMNVNSCGPTSCSQCQPPTDGTATCDGVKCDFTCGKLKRCVDKCYGCCANADCPVTQPGQLGVCDATSHTCTTMCAPGNKSCNGGCIPDASCCTNSDCKAPALQIGMCDPGTRQCVFKCAPGTTKDCGGGKCVPASGCCVDTDCGACKKCSANVCVNQAVGEDLKADCAAAACHTGACDGNGACGLDPNGVAGHGCLAPCRTCQNGICNDKTGACAPARNCNGSDIVEGQCQQGSCNLVTATSCNGLGCSTATTACNACTGTTTKCSGSLVQRCVNGQFGPATSCGDCMSCQSNSCQPFNSPATCPTTTSVSNCVNGKRVTTPCAARTCSNMTDIVEGRCTQGMCGQATVIPCNGLGCTNATACNQCSGTITKCANGQVQTCTNGVFSPPRNCPECNSCAGTGCQPVANNISCGSGGAGTCINGTCNPCGKQVGADCCDIGGLNPACDASSNLVCAPLGPAMCVACGGQDQFCCAGPNTVQNGQFGICNAGLTCTGLLSGMCF